ncbi:MAG: FAD-dependent oxidoreductase [Archaeoglobaceae archaeon]
MDIIVIGGGAAGMKAAARARRRDGEANITVVEAGKFVSLGRCGLPYYIGGIVHEIDDLRRTTYGAVRDEEYFKAVKDIEVLTETRAVAIDREKRVVRISRKGSEDELNYDYLVVATGAKPIKPNVKGVDNERVTGLYSAEEAEKIVEFWEEGAEKAVVVGAGFIGLEACEALRNLEIDVTLVEAMPHVAPAMLDAEMARLVERHLVEKGVEVVTAARVEEIRGEDELVVVAGGREIPADFVVLAVGVKPNVELAEKAGLRIGELGGIVVDERMRTSDERIYAGGDCVETKNVLTGEKVVAPFGDVANKQGRVIGDNVTGGNSIFPGVIGTAIFKVFDLSVATTGLREDVAKRYFDADSVLLSVPDRSHYYPGMSNMRIKLVYDRKTRRVLGAQIVGSGGVDKRIDVIATAIARSATIDDLANLDLAYAPPYSPAIDAVITAANVAQNKLEGLLRSVRAEEARKLVEEGRAVILDVRSEEERNRNPLDVQSIHIPLHELRKRLNELPRDKIVLTICPLGLRAYEASRILIAAGFDARSVEGGLAFWG